MARYWRAVDGEGRMVISGNDTFEPDPADWRPATMREAIKDYLLTARFSWAEFLGIWIVVMVIWIAIRWTVTG